MKSRHRCHFLYAPRTNTEEVHLLLFTGKTKQPKCTIILSRSLDLQTTGPHKEKKNIHLVKIESPWYVVPDSAEN